MIRSPSGSALYGNATPPGLPTEPLIINVCPTGNVLDRAASPHVPLSAAEIIDDALAVIAAGASMIHIHARDAGGRPSSKPEHFAPILEGIRRHAPDAILTVTTSGRSTRDPALRAAVLDLDGAAKPDMASLSLGSLNFPTGASANDPETIVMLCQRMRERGIVPELEAFEMGWINYAFHLQRRGHLPKICYINLLLGSLGSMPGRIEDLAAMARELPDGWSWAGAGIGRHQLPINTAAIIMGGHVRVGLEDNPFHDFARRSPATNVSLVQRLARIAGELGRQLASPRQARTRLRLGDPANWEESFVAIRRMTTADIAAATALLAQWNMAPVTSDSGIVDPEEGPLDPECGFVAYHGARLVGVAAYLLRDPIHGETRSLAVDPDYLGCGIGHRLQEARLAAMHDLGIAHVRTECDRTETIHWYVSRFGYRISGNKRKKHPFSLATEDHWTLLDLDLR